MIDISASLGAMDGSNEIPDEALLHAFTQGDGDAFTRLYHRYRKSLYLYLVRSCDDPSEAEDIYQDVWSRLIGSGQRFSGGSLKAYLFRSARNACVDLRRRKRVRAVDDRVETTDLASAAPNAETRLDAEDCARRLLHQLSVLPWEQRDAFLLKEESGMSLQQIATMLEIGKETIKSRLRYAMQRLRAALEDCL